MKFRFHVLSIPHTRTNLDYTACAYTQKVFKFCKMMHQRGHYIVHYGVEGSNPECDENVTVVSNEIYERVYGNHDYHKNWFKFDESDECYQTFYKNTIEEINKRKQPGDFVLAFWGPGNKPICDALSNMIIVEPGIGYCNSWTQFRAYESYAIMHADQGRDAMLYANPKWYFTVIPNYFDISDFDWTKTYEERKKDPYFLFLGRVYDGKGLNIAIQICRQLGIKLKVAGQLTPEYENFPWDEQIEFVGYADKDKRNELMGGALASIVASTYVEPFGGVQVENLLCGTPTITTDWGAFVENNIEGVTGYRCRTFDDFINAALNCYEGKIKYEDCRKQGEKFSLENIALKYEKFFQDIWNIYNGEGWYQFSEQTQERLKNFKK